MQSRQDVLGRSSEGIPSTFGKTDLEQVRDRPEADVDQGGV
jgi:hypothetical protein